MVIEEKVVSFGVKELYIFFSVIHFLLYYSTLGLIFTCAINLYYICTIFGCWMLFQGIALLKASLGS